MVATVFRVHEFVATLGYDWDPPLTELALYYEYSEEMSNPALRQALGALQSRGCRITVHEIPIYTLTQDEFRARLDEFTNVTTPVDIRIIGQVSSATERLLASLPSLVLFEYE
jgi:hypothetical protein